MDIDQKIARVGIVAALALLSTLGVITYRASVEQEAAATKVAHTHRVLEELQKIASGVAASESSVRAYAITRDPSALKDFESEIALAREALAQAAVLTADNHTQHRLIQAVSPLVEERVTLLYERKQAVEHGEPPGVSKEAQRLTELIRTIVNDARTVEKRLLGDRTVIASERALRARRTTLAGVIASFILVAGAAWLVDRQTRRRLDAERTRLRELGLVLELGEMLQACRTPAEAYEVIERVAPAYFDGLDGALSIIASSRDDAVLVARWGSAFANLERFEIEQCWGLRRSQLHTAGDEGHSMVCGHLDGVAHVSTACLPLMGNGELMGALHLVSDRRLNASSRERLGVFGEQVSLAVANLRLRETLRGQSIRDPLTGLFNRRYTEETLQRELSRSSRDNKPLSVAVLDVDHFKRFNDTHGHEAGDEVLKHIARYLQQQTRGSDVASRLGGEELMVILPGAEAVMAVRKAEQLGSGIRQLKVRVQGKTIEPVTVSIGVSTYGYHGSSAEELMRSADAALYRAKAEGRDRVILAE